MKWINLIYLTISIVIAFIISYAIVNNMINYCTENAPYYLEMTLKYMKYFLLYLLLNIVYIAVHVFKSYNR